LDETYERTLLDISDENWEYAHRLFQCIAVAWRPLHVEELAGFLAFKSEGGSLTFEENWRPENPRDMVLFTCSSLISVVTVNGSPVIQFSHFSVKEYLTSNRIAKGRVSRYYIPLESAHLFVTQACLVFLIQLDEHVTKNSIEEFPLAKYAGQYWAEHVEFGNVSSHTEDLIKRLFNPKNYHFKVWIWIYDTISCRSIGSESPSDPKSVPLHYAARHGFHRVAEWLITTCSQDVNVSRYDSNTAMHIACEYGQFKMVQVLLKHHADIHTRGSSAWAPLHYASWSRNPKPEITRLLLEHGADANSKVVLGITPLNLLSHYNGSVEVAEVLLEHGADPNILATYGDGPLGIALHKGDLGLVQLLLKHGADPKARNDDGLTLLHVASEGANLTAVQRLLELGVDVNSQDNRGTTPLQVASRYEQKHIVQLLLQHGAEGT
jgi:ankyrin repeat protein